MRNWKALWAYYSTEQAEVARLHPFPSSCHYKTGWPPRSWFALGKVPGGDPRLSTISRSVVFACIWCMIDFLGFTLVAGNFLCSLLILNYILYASQFLEKSNCMSKWWNAPVYFEMHYVVFMRFHTSAITVFFFPTSQPCMFRNKLCSSNKLCKYNISTSQCIIVHTIPFTLVGFMGDYIWGKIDLSEV